MHEAHEHPPRHERRLPFDHRLEEGRCRVVGRGTLRVVTRDGIIEERGEQASVRQCRRVLKRAYADVAGRNTGQDRAGQRHRPQHLLASGGDGEAAGGGNPQGVHPFADDVLAEHRAQGRASIAAAGVGGAARTLELDVEAAAVRRELFAHKDCPAVAEVCEIAELVAGICLGDRCGSRRKLIAGKHRGALVPQ